jgi:hypothetical protein
MSNKHFVSLSKIEKYRGTLDTNGKGKEYYNGSSRRGGRGLFLFFIILILLIVLVYYLSMVNKI